MSIINVLINFIIYKNKEIKIYKIILKSKELILNY